MIKDTFFSTSRFINLCRKDMVENWKSNVSRMVLMYGVMAFIMVWNGYSQYGNDMRHGDTEPSWRFVLQLLMCGLFVFGCLSASFTMERMKTKASRLSVLMTPATPFEKFFSRWLVSTVVFLIAFFLAYKLADYTQVLVYSLKYPELDTVAPVPLSHCVGSGMSYYTLFRTWDQFMIVVSIYLFMQSCFVLGSSIWPKNAFLKTFVAGVAIVIVYMMIGVGMASLFLDKTRGFSDIFISEDVIEAVFPVFVMILALMNWTLAYFRFKEAEIINRM